MTKPRFKMVDLFSGAGGLTLGMSWAGFEPVLAVEKEADFAATYAENFGNHCVARDIAAVVESGLHDVRADVVVGGPPCQGFSNLTGNRSQDPRRIMWRYLMRVVEMTEAKVFVCENVPNMNSSAEGAALMKRARELGYRIDSGVLLASDFGVPQNRKRGFIIGSRLGPIYLPSPQGTRVSVRHAFTKGLHPGDAPIPLEPTHTELTKQPAVGPDLHIARKPTAKSLARYKLVPPGGNRFDLQRAAPELTPECWIRKTSGGTDLFGRILYDEPARCTIRTEFFKPEKGRYLHPQAHRPITHWEAARLQSFPDSFRWIGSKIRIAIQIGNAVPPLVAAALGAVVQKHLQDHSSKSVARPAARIVREISGAHS